MQLEPILGHIDEANAGMLWPFTRLHQRPIALQRRDAVAQHPIATREEQTPLDDRAENLERDLAVGVVPEMEQPLPQITLDLRFQCEILLPASRQF
jgi:hypothetical protein